MRKMFLFLTIFPVVCFASEYDFKLHLPCGQNDVCAQFDSESGPVSLRKEPEMVIGEVNLISADINQDKFGRPELNLQMKPEVAKQFTAVTEKAIGSSIAIVVGTKIVSQPSVMQKIESESVRVSSGMGKEPFWSNIPWIKSKAAEKRNAIGEENNRSLMIYAGIGFALLLAALWFVFGRKK
ncbi:MAG: hypothetical protein IPJ71_10930 [Bdellovibrionales bacterium]|nr:hypothetical protein [Bdellovibrionales bacterium]